jgi:hypothetical protein
LPLLGALFVFAAAPASRAFASPEVDDDFAYQGEFWGQMTLPGYPRALVGLQVIAKGDGEFEGRALHGGLPGAGWTGDEPLELKGARQGAFVSLYGVTLRFEVEPNAATAKDSEGNDLGRLERVRRTSPTIGLPAPSYAAVLFTNGEASGLENAELNEDGLLKVGAITKDRFSSFRLHVEFRTPYQPEKKGQGRGNSGCYLLQSYEVQILDSFGLPGAFNECGALYRTVPPLVNMALPPLTWQTYDIFFQAPKWNEAGKKVENAKLTVFQNGQLVQDHLDVPNKTGAGKPESPDLRPILFQNHSDPVAFRNLWIVPGEPNEREIEAIERLSYSPMSVEAFSRLNFAPVSTTAQEIPPQPPSPSDRVIESPEATPESPVTPDATPAPEPSAAAGPVPTEAAPLVVDPSAGPACCGAPPMSVGCPCVAPATCQPAPPACVPMRAGNACFRTFRCWRR